MNASQKQKWDFGQEFGKKLANFGQNGIPFYREKSVSISIALLSIALLFIASGSLRKKRQAETVCRFRQLSEQIYYIPKKSYVLAKYRELLYRRFLKFGLYIVHFRKVIYKKLFFLASRVLLRIDSDRF